MQVCSGLPISQGLAAGKIVFLGAQKAAVRQAVSPQEIVILLVYAFAARTSAPAGRA